MNRRHQDFQPRPHLPAVGLDHNVTKAEQVVLNGESINCIRAFGPHDFRVWGACTVSTDSEWKYVNVRRLFLYVEASIYEGTQWVVFEPDAEPLWTKMRRTVEDFLMTVEDFLMKEWRSGSLPGL